MSYRLTWDSLAPAPYESAWSVFLKVLSANYMSMPELEELIQREPAQRRVPRNHLDSGWIDFDRYASLLGVASERLKEGFLDQLEITPINPTRQIRPGIRQCPRCCKLGYHCVLFDLSIIKECPWHRCKLTESCTHCSFLRTLNPFTQVIAWWSGERICPICGTSLDRFINAPRLNAIDETLKYTIIGYCKEYLGWWDDVREGDSSSFTESLRYVAPPTAFPTWFAPWELGFACTVAKNGLFWKFSVREKPARVISRICSGEIKTEIGNHYLNDDVGRSFRSIRRHIYKKYLRPHHACINYLLHLSRDEALHLHSGKVCIPALAFLTWRMSVEGICNIEGVRSAKKVSIPLRLMTPGFWSHCLAVADRLRWTYDGFFGLLASLEDFHERNGRMAISLGAQDACNG